MPPNILLIVTTQWRAQACGYAGDPNARTPRLDALAARALNFTQAVTPHPFGPFARAAMLTGIESPRNGIGDYFDPLPAGTRTVAHEMGERAYTTAFFGKWHLSPRDSQAKLTGEDHARAIVPPQFRGGFDSWEGFESGFLLNDPWLHGTRLPTPVRIEGYQSDIVCDRAAEMLGSIPASAGPWFGVVSLEAPHPPYGAPAAGVAPQDPAVLVLRGNVPVGGGAAARARADLSGYYAHIEATDRAIGRLLDRLPGDTIAVFTSVHGDMHGSHGLFRKGWPHEESTRVPLLVRLPGASGRIDAPMSLLELPRVITGMAEGRPPAPPGGPSRMSMPSVVALPDQCDRTWSGVRSAARKLVLNADGTPWLFFDLERDPLEMTNLAAESAHALEIRDLAARVRS
jgi:arylsulfatase A-like enzyme